MLRKLFTLAAVLGLLAGAAAAAEKSPAVPPGEAAAQSVAELGKLIDAKHVVAGGDNLKAAVLNAVIKAIDPYGAILTKDQLAQIQEEEKGIFYDAGLKLKIKDKLPQIAELTKDGPAEKAGLQVDDILEKIGERSLQDVAPIDIKQALRGKKGDVITLTVRSPAKDQAGKAPEPRVVKLTCSLPHDPVATFVEDWPQIGYLKVNGLYAGAGTQIVSQLQQWSATNKCGAIIDLRGANGLDYAAAAEVGALFADKGTTLFSIQDGTGSSVTSYQGKADGRLAMPIMVIIDKDTQKAAEILAAALQQCKGAMLIGAPTRGDDRIREAIPLNETEVLYIATRRVELGKNLTFSNGGVQPSVLITAAAPKAIASAEPEEEEEVFPSNPDGARQNKALIARLSGDPALRRAADILLGLKALDIKVH